MADAGPVVAAGFREAGMAVSGKGFPCEERELVVVGGGPAGLCAALQASQAVGDVLVLDEADSGGGQLRKQIHRFFGSREHGAGKRGYQIAEELTGECRASGVEMRLSSAVLGFFPGGELMVDGPEGLYVLKARATVLCTGAAEKSLAFPGWTLPGVMGAGAAQTLVNIHGVLPGRRILMVGSGNVGLIVTYQLLQAGAEVVGIVEAGEKVGGYQVHLSRVRREGVPVYLNHRLLAAEGEEEVESVLVESVREGRVLRFRADCVCLAVGMTPQVELAAMRGCRMSYAPALGGFVPWHDPFMRTSVEGVFTAGDAAGVEEASVAMEEGRMAGLAACEYLGKSGGRSAERKKREVLKRLEMLRGGSWGQEKARAKAALRARRAGEGERGQSVV